MRMKADFGLVAMLVACNGSSALESPTLGAGDAGAITNGNVLPGAGGTAGMTEPGAGGESGGGGSITEPGATRCPDFCATQPRSGLLVCDDFSVTTPEPPRELLPWNDMPSLTAAVADCALVFAGPTSFSANYARLGQEMGFRNTSIEATMSAETEVRSLSAVCWGDPSNLISAGLQRDERALYLHVVVGGQVTARIAAEVAMAPGQSRRVKMEVGDGGQIRCYVDGQLVLATTQDLSGLPRTLAPGVNVNSYPPAQRLVFDDFVVRALE